MDNLLEDLSAARKKTIVLLLTSMVPATPVSIVGANLLRKINLNTHSHNPPTPTTLHPHVFSPPTPAPHHPDVPPKHPQQTSKRHPISHVPNFCIE